MTAVSDAVGPDREIVVSRVFDAPRELVFEVFTTPEHVVHWWGPDGFTNTIYEMDVRPGGIWRFVMHGPDGRDYLNIVRYLEVIKPERLQYEHGSGRADKQGDFQATITFEDVDGKTRVTMRSVFPTAADRERVIKVFNAVEGAKQNLGRLADYLIHIGANK